MAKKSESEETKALQDETDVASASDPGEVLLRWEFSEFEMHARSVRWYIIAGIFILLILAFAYYDKNPLFAIIIILVMLTFAISEYRGADTHVFAITQDGLLVEQAFYPYADIKNFFLIYQPPRVKMLYFDPKSIARPLIGIPLGDQDPNAVRKILATFIPEDLDQEDEPMSDFLGRLFKF